jgi:hypothetical protein
MKCVVAILLVLIVQQAAGAEVLVGTATLKFKAQTKYQPGSCETLPPEEAKGVVCINMWPWSLHDVVNFRDIRGRAHKVTSIVVTAHQPLTGEWLLVIEKLPHEEAAKFGAKYKVIERSPVVPFACLDVPIGKYTDEQMPTPLAIPGFGSKCYDMRMPQRGR